MFEKWKYPWNKQKDNDDVGAEDEVYAGPEFFEQQEKPMGRVYAGPEYNPNKMRPMECVYAGPEYFNGRPANLGMQIDDAEERRQSGYQPVIAETDGNCCPACGAELQADALFCHNCGATVPQEEA